MRKELKYHFLQYKKKREGHPENIHRESEKDNTYYYKCSWIGVIFPFATVEMLSTVLKMPGKSTAAASSLTGYKAALAIAALTLGNLSWAFNLFAEVEDREHDYFTESFLHATSTDSQDLKPVYSGFGEKDHSLTVSGSVSMLKQKHLSCP